MIFRLLWGAVLCLLVASGAVASGPVQTGTLSGRVLGEGGNPLANGSVVLFRRGAGPPPAPDRYWLVPDYVEDLDDDGRFSVAVEAGAYYLAAIKRNNRKEIGPPKDGELFLVAADAKGMPATFTVKGGETAGAGTIAGVRPFGKETAAARPAGFTAIEGTIVDGDGKPVEGVIVFAFTSPTMVGKPLFVSERSGKEGNYLLRVAAGGVYYLKVRDVYGGGEPAEGTVYATFGGDIPSAVNVDYGDVKKGVTIPVSRFERPTRKKGNR
ncbi:carboxypeptidase-like regulatory domain-containing protein [Geobacter grbiciae]|uniref:carboxypeptidase-like regulatory domain-containing protein n=1 Tax=Geobacter grbiciae TaxID=155042 RepID=UPI001C017F2C|nr:carboxypeptidase-like regulatory domain-containing protein [Geobacter grbiciae]MBT1076650.1 carboxypeptidase regulatory-like domain-containing protein [Geobacter grbiciae]